MRRFAPALLVAVFIVAMAPLAGEVRDLARDLLAEGFVRTMALAFAAAVAAVVGAVAARIRTDRLRRYALLVTGLVLLFGQLAGWSRDDAAVNAVERIHFLYYGLLAFLWLRGFRRGRADLAAPLQALLATLLVALADEGVQWLLAARTGELYDVVLDVYAGATGVLLGLALDGLDGLASRLGGAGAVALARLAAASLVAVAAFVHTVHLGYRIVDPEVGSFRSVYSAAGLEAASRDRAVRWAAHPLGPPGAFGLLEPEDRYRSEAGNRVQHRNAALERGDAYQAWKENLILERWFAPFLGQINRDGRPFRLPSETRAALERGRPRPDPYPFDSPVGRVPFRVWLWPSKPLLWTATLALAGVLLSAPVAAAALRRRRGSGRG